MRSEILDQMCAWAQEGEAIARRYWRRTGELEFKSGREAVTEADRRIEVMLRERIAEAYPDDHIVGEEMGGRPGPGASAAAARRTWQLDPIDGTLNFALGLPGFCTSLAVLEGQDVLAACIHAPIAGDTFTAERGCGAWRNGEPIRVSTRAVLDEAIVSTQFKAAGRYVQNVQLLSAFHTRIYKLRRVGAIALELARVADGSYDALVASVPGGLKPWDVAAGMLLVSEAGGVVSDHRGRDYRLDGEDLVAGSAPVHRALLDLVAQIG